MALKTLKLGLQSRQADLDLTSLNEEKRTIEVSFSSEEPVKRWYGMEILGHKPSEVRLDFANRGAASCDEHWGPQVAVTDKAWIKSGRGRAILRFARDEEGEKKLQRVKDGICRWVSCLYVTHKMQLIKADKDTGVNTYRAIDWEPLTIDFVNIPADSTVGVGRGADDSVREIPVIGGQDMDPCKVCGKPQGECTCPAGGTSSRSAPNPDPTVVAQTAAATTTMTPPAQPAIQVRQVEERATNVERDRVTEILALGRDWNKREFAEKHVKDNTPLDQFRSLLFAELKTGANPSIRPVRETDADLGIRGRELERYSVLKLCRALADPQDRKAQTDAAFELECSSAYQERALKEGHKKEVRGASIPPEVLRAPIPGIGPQYRAFEASTPDAGGYLVPTTLRLETMIEYLWKRIVVSDRIQKFTGLIGNVLLPKEVDEGACYWIGEDGTATEETGADIFGQVALVSKTVGMRAGITRKLLMQTSMDVEGWLRRHIGRKFGSELERVLLVGSGGAGEPTGIFYVTGVGGVTFSNGAIDWAHAVELETDVADANADVADMAYVTNAVVRGQAKVIEKVSGYPVFIMDDQNRINGYPCLVTNHVPRTFGVGSNRSGIAFGNWMDLAIGLWGGMDLIIDRISSNTGQVILKGFQDADVAALRAQSFSVGTDIDHTLTQ